MDWFSKAEGRTAVNQCGRAQLDSPGVYGKECLQIQLRSSLLAPTPRTTLSPSHTYFMSIQCSKYSMFPYSSCCSAYFDSTQPSVLEWLLYKGIKIATLNYWQTRHVLHLEQRVFQKFSSSIHLESSHCSALSSYTGSSCCTFSPNPDFTPILIQPWRDLSFQNISWYLTFCSSQDPWDERRTDSHLKSRLARFFLYLHRVHWGLHTKAEEGHQDFICMTQKGFSQPISWKNRSPLSLEGFYADSKVTKAKKEQAKNTTFLPGDDCPESTHEGSRWHAMNRCWIYKKVSRASTCKSNTFMVQIPFFSSPLNPTFHEMSMK